MASSPTSRYTLNRLLLPRPERIGDSIERIAQPGVSVCTRRTGLNALCPVGDPSVQKSSKVYDGLKNYAAQGHSRQRSAARPSEKNIVRRVEADESRERLFGGALFFSPPHQWTTRGRRAARSEVVPRRRDDGSRPGRGEGRRGGGGAGAGAEVGGRYYL